MNSKKDHNQVEKIQASSFDVAVDLLEIVSGSENVIDALLEKVAAYYDADRAYVFEINDARTLVSNTYEWCKEGVVPEIENLQNLDIIGVALWIKEFEKSGAFYISSLDKDVDKNSFTYEVLEPQNIESLVTAPLYTEGVITGFIGVDNPQVNVQDLIVLKMAASMIYGGISRRIAEKEKAESVKLRQTQLFSDLLINTFESAYYIDLDHNTCIILKQQGYTVNYDVVDNWRQMAEYYLYGVISERDRERISLFTDAEKIKGVLSNQTEHSEIFTEHAEGKERYVRISVLRGEDDSHAVMGFMNVDADVRKEQKIQADLIRAQQESDEQNENYHALHEILKSGEWYVYFNEEGKFDRVVYNDEFRRLLGYKDENDFPNTLQAWADTFHEQDRERIIAEFDDVYNDYTNEPIYSVKYQAHVKGVGYRWFKSEGKVVRRPDGSPIRFFGAFVDIENEVQAERRLSVISSMADDYECVCTLNRKTQEISMIRVANHIKELLDTIDSNLTIWQRLDQLFHILVHPDDLPAFIENTALRVVDEKTRDGSVYKFTFRTLENGKEEYFRVKFAADKSDPNVMIVGFVNIDKQIRSEMALAAERERSRQEQMLEIFGESCAALMHINLDTDTYEVIKNDGFIPKDIVAKYPKYSDGVNAWFANINEKTGFKSAVQTLVTPSALREILTDKEMLEKRFETLFTKNPVWYEMRIMKTRDFDTTHGVYVTFFNRDEEIRKEKAYQDQLRESRDAAQAANMAKTSFLNSMSHDIRTPMNAIIGYTNMAKKYSKDKHVKEYLDKIDVSGNQLLTLINQVLEMSRIESGKVILKRDVANVVERAFAMETISGADVQKKKLTFSLKIGDIEHKHVETDAARMDQIITNILSNAIKYSREGGTIIYSLNEEPCEKHGYSNYVIAIEDNGIGMSSDYLDRVYDEFTREETSTVSKIQGSGLGLSIVKRLVELLEGTIAIESKQGIGTKVTVNIPMKWSEAEDEKDSASNIKTRDSLKGVKILLVEDNEMNREIATDILEEHGVRVTCAEDGDIAVKMLKASKAGDFDLVLMDIQMPRMNGLEATKAIRAYKDKRIANIPIIATTANAFDEDRQAAMEAGMNAHVAKPINVEKLKEAISQFI